MRTKQACLPMRSFSAMDARELNQKYQRIKNELISSRYQATVKNRSYNSKKYMTFPLIGKVYLSLKFHQNHSHFLPQCGKFAIVLHKLTFFLVTVNAERSSWQPADAPVGDVVVSPHSWPTLLNRGARVTKQMTKHHTCWTSRTSIGFKARKLREWSPFKSTLLLLKRAEFNWQDRVLRMIFVHFSKLYSTFFFMFISSSKIVTCSVTAVHLTWWAFDYIWHQL